jgi:hypothetical protein
VHRATILPEATALKPVQQNTNYSLHTLYIFSQIHKPSYINAITCSVFLIVETFAKRFLGSLTSLAYKKKIKTLKIKQKNQ